MMYLAVRFNNARALLLRISCALLVLALLSACGTRKQALVRAPHATAAEQTDSAPPEGFDLSSVVEPVPVDEPRARYGNHSPYFVYGKRYEVLPDHRGYLARGTASWYGTKFHGRLTSNREPYDMYAYTAAHKSLPLPSYARVTNLDNGRSVVVRINDRGPFVGDRLIDLSYAAAVKLGVHLKGTAPVEVRVLQAQGLPAPTASLASGGPLITAIPSEPQLTARSSPAQPFARPVMPPIMPGVQAASGFFQQCGAFGTLDNARMLMQRLRNAGLAQVDVMTADGAAPHRVVVGPYADRVTALAAQSELANRGFPGCHVLTR
jgi:rare lipoprotein A